MRANHRETQTISEQASQWLGILADGGDAERAEFLKWLKQSPRHIEEFLFASATWQRLRESAAESPMEIDAILAEFNEAKGADIIPLQDALTTRATAQQPAAVAAPSKPARRAIGHWRWAAAIAVVAIAASYSWWLSANANLYVTAVGEQRIVQLADGSVLYLNTDSRTRVTLSEHARDVELLEGEALFVVAHDTTRPFRVKAGTAVIQAVGTQFNVHRVRDDTHVAVLEGRVKLADSRTPATPNATPNLLSAGEEAVIASDGGIIRQATADRKQTTAWRERRLVFRAERLEDVVNEINRYNTRRFQIDGDAARNTRLTATFDADSPESLATFLKQYSNLSVHPDGSGFVIRSE
ncbi:FecR family protein [Steroidobacter sp.]|uniref:FecR family protein n=1 Tax=Steroidobacter sp. TaxID=1978227 RepID=UPI001A3D6E5B|nr:FecR domain-containing protein [Steroidobacter sp.]MBL8271159.1 FecR domain-containing protein [Steroidobacter sp.]